MALVAELYDGEVLVGTYNTIQAAINDALNTNTIKVGPGTYAEAPNITPGLDDLTIESTDGAAQTIIDPNAAAAANDALVDANEDGLTLQDCVLDLTVNAVADIGVDVAGVDGVSINNCTFNVTGTDEGINASGAATNLSIDDCTFINGSLATQGAIDVDVAITAPDELLVRDSTFEDNLGYSIDTVDGDNIRAIFNDFTNNGEGMRCLAVANLEATHNWWGDASGPGTGDAVSTLVNFEPWYGAPISAGEFALGAASLNAQATVAVTVSGVVAEDIMVARYTACPVAEPGFTPIENGFFDVYVGPGAVGAGATEVGIKFYDAAITTDSRAWVWDAFEEVWKLCTEQNAVAGMVWAKARPFDIDHPRDPTIEDLAGTPFAISMVPAVYLESIAASPSSVSLNVGDTQQLTVTATYSDASTADVTATSTYVSSDTSVTTVSTGGLITAVAEGSAIITVSYTEAGIEATDTVSVTVTIFDGVITKDQALQVIVEYMG